MAKHVDLTGLRFGKVTIKSIIGHSDKGVHYSCLCDCGKVFESPGKYFTKKHQPSRSCGCARIESITRHGLSRTPEYAAWCDMKNRCYNPNLNNYYLYGGRGIEVCDRWLESFQNFHDDMGDRPSKMHSLDRIEVNGNYEKNNCRWTSDTVQQRNRRDNVLISTPWGKITMAEAAEKSKLKVLTITSRRRSGWPDEMLLTPVIFGKPLKNRLPQNN